MPEATPASGRGNPARHPACQQPRRVLFVAPLPRRAAICRRGRDRRRTAARQPRVERIAATSSSCVPGGDDAPALHHGDPVGVAHRREPMRDDQHGAPRHQPLERELHHALALGIERARRLVEQQDRAIGEDRARDRQPLPLPAGQPHAALAELARVAAAAARAMNSVANAASHAAAHFGVGRARAGRSGRSRARSPRRSPGPAARRARRARTSRGIRGRAGRRRRSRTRAAPADRRSAAAAGTPSSCPRPTARPARRSRRRRTSSENSSSAGVSGRDG